MRTPDRPRATATTTPEPGFRAAETLLAQTAPCGAHALETAALLPSMRPPAELALGELLAPPREVHPRTAAVVSSRKTLISAEISIVSGAMVSERGPGMDVRGHASGGA